MNIPLPPFYIGQKVIYITGKKMPKDSLHTVSDIQKTPCGCCWGIAIDGDTLYLGSPPPEYLYFTCKYCKRTTRLSWRCRNSGIRSWAATSFRPLQSAPPPSLTFTRIREEEKEQVLWPN